jgi:ketol-acid reductoisomerase
MVAPKGLGPMVRSEFINGRGVPGLIAIGDGAKRRTKAVALAWAKGIGCTRAGVILTTFKEETETDLFGEQAVLCGGLTALIHAAFSTLVKGGYPAELAYYECLHELKFIVDLIHERGIAGMRERISTTAKFGDVTVGPRLIDRRVETEMARVLREIQNGAFARQLAAELGSGGKRLRALLQEGSRSELERTGARLRRLMAWRQKE